jgi:hypothetical protein
MLQLSRYVLMHLMMVGPFSQPRVVLFERMRCGVGCAMDYIGGSIYRAMDYLTSTTVDCVI